MRKDICRTITALLVFVLMPIMAMAQTSHSNITWNGPGTCLTCHLAEANEVHSSVHYQWQGPALYTVNGPAIQGKLNTAVNSYCINILGNWGTCGNCHVGLGAKPEPISSTSQLENIDCLICHQKEYKRKKVNGIFVPDTTNMTISMDQAVQTVHRPERSNCLQCHAKGGGGDNNKRGDIAMAHSNTADRSFDVHMAKTGANLLCQNCHTTKEHKIAGRGSDLRETDLDIKMSCVTSSCHSTKLSSTGHATVAVNRHVKKVACQTCHIKSYARNAADTTSDESTEIYRDWSKPEWVSALNRWEPTITRASNLKPLYRFWNSYSYNYNLNETVSVDPKTEAYPTSRPIGDIKDAASKLYPFKYKKALQPIATTLGKLIALDTSVYFATGNLDSSVKQGLINMGLSSSTSYSMVETDTYQLITHEVMPKENALTCSECHTSSATQMNLKEMGYVLKGSASTICSQCHSYKDPTKVSYTSLHQKHVSDKKYDCSWCHSFTRVTYPLNVTKTGTGSGVVVGSPVGISCGSDCSEEYSNGTLVTLTAIADAGSKFSGWSGACSGTGSCTVTMNTAKTVTAIFDSQPNIYTLTVSKSGTGSGSVTSTPVGISCGSDCSEAYTSGTSVTLLATASADSTFGGWSGDSDCSDGVVLMNSNKNCIALFNLTTSTTSPDLVISSLIGPSSTKVGTIVAITDTTKNIGDGSAKDSTTKYYLSSNKRLDSSDIYLGSRSVSSLGSGASNTGSINVTIPSNLSAGRYYIIAKADGDSTIVESNETNNIRRITVYITK